MSHLPASIKNKIMVEAHPPLEAKYWNKDIETMPRGKLMELQWELLQPQIRYVYENSPFYRKRLEEAGVTPNDIHSMEDFKREVPITSKDDIRTYIEQSGDIFGGTLCMSLKEVLHFGPSTGTSGVPTQTAFTEEDGGILSECGARQAWSLGLRPGDLFPIWMVPGHPGYMGIVQLLEKIKAPYTFLAYAVPFQEAELERWTKMMQELPVASSYLPYSMLWTYKDYIERHGLSPQETLGRTRFISTSGDILTPTMRQWLENYWGIDVHEFVISADVLFGFYTCEARNGLHFSEDLFAMEVVDPQTGEPVPMGQPGYLIVTPTWTEGTCHLRWNSEDIVHMSDEPCLCGRTSARIWFHGRLAYRVNVQGRDIFPSEVTDELLQIPEIGVKAFVCELVRTSPKTQDKLIVRTAYDEGKVKDMSIFRGRVEEKLQMKFGLPVAVEFMEPEQAKSHKVERVVKRY